VTAAALAIVDTFRHRYELNPELAALDDDNPERHEAEHEVTTPISPATVEP
jgi:hypothetical protein